MEIVSLVNPVRRTTDNFHNYTFSIDTCCIFCIIDLKILVNLLFQKGVVGWGNIFENFRSGTNDVLSQSDYLVDSSNNS